MATKATRTNMRKHPGALMLCPCCLATWSATDGDYFQYPVTYVFRCEACDEECVLVTEAIRYKDV